MKNGGGPNEPDDKIVLYRRKDDPVKAKAMVVDVAKESVLDEENRQMAAEDKNAENGDEADKVITQKTQEEEVETSNLPLETSEKTGEEGLVLEDLEVEISSEVEMQTVEEPSPVVEKKTEDVLPATHSAVADLKTTTNDWDESPVPSPVVEKKEGESQSQSLLEGESQSLFSGAEKKNDWGEWAKPEPEPPARLLLFAASKTSRLAAQVYRSKVVVID